MARALAGTSRTLLVAVCFIVRDDPVHSARLGGRQRAHTKEMVNPVLPTYMRHLFACACGERKRFTTQSHDEAHAEGGLGSVADAAERCAAPEEEAEQRRRRRQEQEEEERQLQFEEGRRLTGPVFGLPWQLDSTGAGQDRRRFAPSATQRGAEGLHSGADPNSPETAAALFAPAGLAAVAPAAALADSPPAPRHADAARLKTNTTR